MFKFKMCEVFNRTSGLAVHVNITSVNENFDDGVTPFDAIDHAVSSHDELVERVKELETLLLNLTSASIENEKQLANCLLEPFEMSGELRDAFLYFQNKNGCHAPLEAENGKNHV